jgi:hypothetical protein
MEIFIPSILNFKGFQFNTLTELNAEISLMQRENPSSELLKELKAYRTDILFMVENLSMSDFLKDIMSAWQNYRIARKYESENWMKSFATEISFMSYLLHIKLIHNPYEK